MNDNQATNRSKARSALRLPSPADVNAYSRLWTDDPECSVRLRDAVVAACSRPVRGVDMTEVCGVAVLSVARFYYSVAGRHDSASKAERHAVRSAVMAARTTVLTAAAGDDVESLEADGVRTRLAHWTAPADRIGSVDSLRSRMADRFALLPDDVREVFGDVAGTWLRHVPAACVRCSVPGARPGRLDLASIRSHAAGLAPLSPRARAMRRKDAAVVAAVADVLRPIVERSRFRDGETWSRDSVIVAAWRAVVRGDSAMPLRSAGRPDVVWRESVRSVESVAVVPSVVRDVESVAVAVPVERRSVVAARREAAWQASESGRVAALRVRQDRDRGTRSGRVEWQAAGDSAPDPWGRSVPVPGGRVAVTSGDQLPLWTHGPERGPAPAPAAPVESGRYAAEPREVAGTVRRVTGSVVVTARILPVAPSRPDVESVTVTRDGVTVVRAMTEAERDASKRVPEFRTVAGETVPVVAGSWPGESSGYGDGTTAPAPAGDRVAGEPDAPVRSFPVRTSPRKRPGSNTGPTIPVRLR